MVVALLLAIGTAYDLLRGHGRTPPPAPEPAGAPVVAADHDGPGAAPHPPRDPTSIEARPGTGAAAVDLNRATPAELDALPGIGPVLAGRIIAYRRAHGAFRSVEDLLDVPGIGPALVERVRGRVRIGGAASLVRPDSIR